MKKNANDAVIVSNFVLVKYLGLPETDCIPPMAAYGDEFIVHATAYLP